MDVGGAVGGALAASRAVRAAAGRAASEGRPCDGLRRDGRRRDGRPCDGLRRDGRRCNGRPCDGLRRDGRRCDGRPCDGLRRDGRCGLRRDGRRATGGRVTDCGATGDDATGGRVTDAARRAAMRRAAVPDGGAGDGRHGRQGRLVPRRGEPGGRRPPADGDGARRVGHREHRPRRRRVVARPLRDGSGRRRPLDERAHLLDQVAEREGLQQEGVGAGVEHGPDARLGAHRGDGDERHALEPGQGPHGAQQVLPVHVGHQDVAHHAVGPDLGDAAQRGRPGREGVGLELGRPERALEQEPDLRVVVDHDHSPGGVHDGARGQAVCAGQSLRPRFGVSTRRPSPAYHARDVHRRLGGQSTPGQGRVDPDPPRGPRGGAGLLPRRLQEGRRKAGASSSTGARTSGRATSRRTTSP